MITSMWGDHLIRYQTLLPDKGEIRLLEFLHRICIPALVDLSWLYGTRSYTLKDGIPSSTFVAKLLIKIDHAKDRLHLHHNRLFHITVRRQQKV